MYFAITAAVLTGLTSAFPSHIDIPARGEGTFSVTTPARSFKGGKYGPLALAKAYNKFGVELPADLKAAVARIKSSKLKERTTGSVVNVPEEYDEEYNSDVSIGTPAQVLPLDFDTGSSDLWVFSTQTPSDEVDGQTLYDPGSSSTAKLLSGESWSITYGDGSTSSGDVYSDVVTVGGLTVTGQAVESAEEVSDEFTEDSACSGLLGLGFSNINTVSPNQQKTFFANAIPQLNEPLFTADLKHDADGHYNFGYIDTTVNTSAFTYTSVSSSEGYWSWVSTGYAIGTASFTSTSISGIADTGTTLLLLPTSIVKAYYKKVSGSSYSNSEGGYIFPCSATLPTFTFGVGSSTITVPSSYLNYAPVTSTECYGSIQEDTGIGFAIFGDIALKSAFVVFNGASSPSLGWATKTLD